MREGDSSGTSREASTEQIASATSRPKGIEFLQYEFAKNLNFSHGAQE